MTSSLYHKTTLQQTRQYLVEYQMSGAAGSSVEQPNTSWSMYEGDKIELVAVLDIFAFTSLVAVYIGAVVD